MNNYIINAEPATIKGEQNESINTTKCDKLEQGIFRITITRTVNHPIDLNLIQGTQVFNIGGNELQQLTDEQFLKAVNECVEIISNSLTEALQAKFALSTVLSAPPISPEDAALLQRGQLLS